MRSTAAFCVFLLSCGADLVTPRDDVIACRSDSECPSSFRCNLSTDRCQVVITNNAPVVALEVLPATPRWVRGVTLRATISDVESDPVDLDVQFSLSEGACPANIDPSLGGVTELESSPTGVAHTFVWTAAADAQQEEATDNCGLEAVNVLSALTQVEIDMNAPPRPRTPCAGGGPVPEIDGQDTDISVDCVVSLENLTLTATPTDRAQNPRTGPSANATDVIGEAPPIVAPFFDPPEPDEPPVPEFDEIVPIEFFVLDQVTDDGLGADFVDVEVEFSVDGGTSWATADVDGPTRRLLATPRSPDDDDSNPTPDPAFEVTPFILVWEADSNVPSQPDDEGGLGSEVRATQVFVRMRGRTTFGNDVIVGDWREAGPIVVDTN